MSKKVRGKMLDFFAKDSEIDIFIKDEGYADVRVSNPGAKKFLVEKAKVKNYHTGKHAYSNSNPSGSFSFGLSVKNGKLTKNAQKCVDILLDEGFNICSEF